MSRRILVPLDGSLGSEAVLDEVQRLGEVERVTVRLLCVAPPAEARSVDGRVIAYADQEAARIRHDALAYLRSAAALLSGLEVELAVRFGDPAEEILGELKSAGVDLVAMATHRRSGLDRLVHRSVAERILRASPAPVLLVPHGEGAQTPASTDGEPLVRRRIWCGEVNREVEVVFEAQGIPGFRRLVAVRSCTAFDPSTAVICHRRCLDPTFHRQWEPTLPVRVLKQPSDEEGR